MTTPAQELTLKPIGFIRSPHQSPAGTPIQSVYAEEFDGEIVVREDLEPALLDIDGFDRLWLIYAFDRAGAFKPRVIPYRDTREHGLLATRSPSRPNPLGLSVVRLLGRDRNIIRIRGVDVLDGTPLLDIKPYVPEFDAHPTSKAGWFDEVADAPRVADDRFHQR